MEHVVTKRAVAEAFKERLEAHYGERLVKMLRMPHDPYSAETEPEIIYLIAIFDPELSEDERHDFFGVITGMLLEEGGPYYVDAHPLSRSAYQHGRDAAAFAARERGSACEGGAAMG